MNFSDYLNNINNMEIYPNHINKYFLELYSRHNEAIFLEKRILKLPLDYQPIEKRCHDNVDKIVSRYESFESVRGWLYFDYDGYDFVGFAQHSVLRFPDGKIRDVTPSTAIFDYPFIIVNESDDTFFEKEKHLIDGFFKLSSHSF